MITEEQIQSGVENYSEVGKRMLSSEQLRRFVVGDLKHFEEQSPYRKLAEEIGEEFAGVEYRENIYTDRDFAIIVLKKRCGLLSMRWARMHCFAALKHKMLPDLSTLRLNKNDKESKFLLLLNDCNSHSFKKDAEAIYNEFPIKYPSRDEAQGMVVFINNAI